MRGERISLKGGLSYFAINENKHNHKLFFSFSLLLTCFGTLSIQHSTSFVLFIAALRAQPPERGGLPPRSGQPRLCSAGKLRRPILRSCPAPPVTDLPSTRREFPRHLTLPRPSLHHPHLTAERPAWKGSHSPPTSYARPGLRSSSSSHCPVPLQARSTHTSLGSNASASSPTR